MILWLHRLREDEEGQTLILGAVFGIILALCILGTVNLGRAVYEKMQVQTACDNGAYSQAAVEARVLNLTAYTNRAMVVHYSSMMAMSAYLTWIHFTYVFVRMMNEALSFIPYIGEVFTVLNEIFDVVVAVMDWAVAFLTPIISAANLVLWGLQEGAWLGLYLNRLSQIPPEAHSGDSNSDAYRPIWPNLIPTANQNVFAQTRGSTSPMTNLANSAKILINSSDPNVQLARLHMVEIANSAREPWVAYGDRYGNAGGSPLARHWAWPFHLCNIKFGVNARTELGTRAPAGLLGALNGFGEIFSGSRLQLSAHCTFLVGFHINTVVSLFTLTALDELNPLGAQSTYQGPGTSGGVFGHLLSWAFSGIGFGGIATYASDNPIQADYRAMWISPYVSFMPSTKAGPAGGNAAAGSGLGNFGQPDIIFGLARQRADYNRDAGAAVVGKKFTGILGGSNAGGSVDFSYTPNDWPVIPGLPAPLQLHEGFNALCAAQTYYHRPGDWREMPNFFNPLWAARLMPVTEANAAAALGVNSVPLLQQLLLH